MPHRRRATLMLQCGMSLAWPAFTGYTPHPMSEPHDLDALADRCIDLWQDQMAAMAGDPELAEAFRRLFQLWGFGGLSQAASGQAGDNARSGRDRAPSSAAARR